MSKRVRVPPELNHARTLRIRGVMARGELSPYDFPVAAEVGFDEGAREFMLRFIYPGATEPEVEAFSRDNVKLYSGEKSGRLFRVRILDISEPRQIPQIAIEAIIHIEQNLEQVESGYPLMQQLNYAVAREFLENQGAELTMAS